MLVEAWFALGFFDLCLVLLPFDRVRRLANGDRIVGQTSDPRMARRINWLVTVASRWHLVPMTCLRQSLALQWMLQRRRIESKLQLGVKRSSEFEAHAWLEYEGHQQEMIERSRNSYYLLPVPGRTNS